MTSSPAGSSGRPSWAALALFLVVGGIAGLGGFTFMYAGGTGYLLDDPTTCANCHVMHDVFDSWNRSPHHAVAVCNDCHTPHTFPEKYIIKGLNGINHSTRFTLGDYPANIRITDLNASVVQANCIYCHADTINNVVTIGNPHGEDVRCARCHADVGH